MALSLYSIDRVGDENGRIQMMASRVWLQKIFTPSHGLLLGLISFAYVFLASWRLDLPGIHGDELSIAPLLMWMEGNYKHTILGPYHGVSESILAAPFFIVLGKTPLALRLTSLFYSWAALVFYYWFVWRYYENRRMAFMLTLVLGLSGTYLIGTRAGMHYGYAMFAPMMLMAFLLMEWRRTGKASFFLGASVSAGLAWGCRIWFVWLIVAVLLTLLLLNPPFYRHLTKTLPLKTLLLGALLCGGVALGPILYYNMAVEPRTLRFLLESSGGGFDFSLGSYFSRLLTRLFQWNEFLSQNAWANHMAPPVPFRNTASLWLFWGAAGTLLFFQGIGFWRGRKIGRIHWAPPLILLFYILQSPLTPNESNSHIVCAFLLYPLVLGSGVMAACDLVDSLRGRRVVRLAFFLGVALILLGDAFVYISFRAQLLETKGRGLFSQEIVRLTRFAVGRGVKTLYLPGRQGVVGASMDFVSGGALKTQDWSLPPEGSSFVAEAGPEVGFVSFYDPDIVHGRGDSLWWGDAPRAEVEAINDYLKASGSLQVYRFSRSQAEPILALHLKRRS